MTITKIYVTAVITAIIIIIAVTATTTTAVPNVAVLATPAPVQGGNNATNATNATTGATSTTTPPPPAAGQQQQQQNILITKHGSNSYVISGGSSSVGSFDTTYRVAGERSALRAAEHLIISTITDDFRKSPTIGYITPGDTTTTGTTTAPEPTLPNPFATPEQITERITTEVRRVISEAESNTSQGQYVEIKCNFGMSLEDMRCHYHPLLQARQG
jgi:hypothetical protein